MPLKDAACHVWAIDGYTDDGRMAVVHNAFVECADARTASLLNAEGKRQRREAVNYDTIVQEIINTVRIQTQATLTQLDAIIYGGFRNANVPEHWWLEYGDTIYDTMPDYALFSVPASAQTRIMPFLEQAAFLGPGTGVGSFRTKLTVSQQAIIAAGTELVNMKEGVTIGDASDAATKIQALARGYLVRKGMETKI